MPDPGTRFNLMDTTTWHIGDKDVIDWSPRFRIAVFSAPVVGREPVWLGVVFDRRRRKCLWAQIHASRGAALDAAKWFLCNCLAEGVDVDRETRGLRGEGEG